MGPAIGHELVVHEYEEAVCLVEEFHGLAAHVLVEALLGCIERRVVDEGVTCASHIAPTARELLVAELLGGSFELLTCELGEQSTDTTSDRALPVQNDLPDHEVRPSGGEDPVDDVLEKRLEERRNEDDDDLGFPVLVVAADSRVEPLQAFGGKLSSVVAGRSTVRT